MKARTTALLKIKRRNRYLEGCDMKLRRLLTALEPIRYAVMDERNDFVYNHSIVYAGQTPLMADDRANLLTYYYLVNLCKEAHDMVTAERVLDLLPADQEGE